MSTFPCPNALLVLSSPPHPQAQGRAPGIKFINNIIHDGSGAILNGSGCSNCEIYGSIVYYTRQSYGGGAIYHNSPNRYENNIVFASGGIGLLFEIFSETNETTYIEKNIVFQNGRFFGISWNNDNIHYINHIDDDAVFSDNRTYFDSTSLTHSTDFFTGIRVQTSNLTTAVTNNYVMGGNSAALRRNWDGQSLLGGEEAAIVQTGVRWNALIPGTPVAVGAPLFPKLGKAPSLAARFHQ